MNTYKHNAFRVFSLVLFTFFGGTWGNLLHGYRLMMGTIESPEVLGEPIPVYASGCKIKTNIDEVSRKKVYYGIPTSQYNKTFYVCVTPQIDFQTYNNECLGSPNIIEYLKVPEKQAYKLYKLDLTTRVIPEKKKEKEKDTQPHQKLKKEYTWKIQELELDESRRMPDDTIIICFSPECIEKLEGGSAFEFPTMVLKQNMVELVGSKETLSAQHAAFVLSSIDYDTIHAKLSQNIKQDQQRTLIAPLS